MRTKDQQARIDRYVLDCGARTLAERLVDLEDALARLADASEVWASSDPDMLSHADADNEFDAALKGAREIIDQREKV